MNIDISRIPIYNYGNRKEGAMISFKPLWKQLIDKDMKKMDLVERGIVSRGTLAKMGKDGSIKLAVVDRICSELDCSINDVIEYVRE